MKVNYLNYLSQEKILGQVKAILNYSPNVSGTNKFDLASCISNFSLILSPYVKTGFKDSLNNSTSCILKPSLYRECISYLKTEKESFILAPLSASEHLFSIFIQKKDANSFSATVINKGYIPEYISATPYTKYIIKKENMNGIIDILADYESKKLSVEEIYAKFIISCNTMEFLENIVSLPQKEGNCFFKELEAGIKYAYSDVYKENFTTPKLPLPTISAHLSYVNNIEETVPEIKQYTKDITSVYFKNKMFRYSLKKLPNYSNVFYYNLFSYYEKLLQFKIHFGYSENANLEDYLKLIDRETLSENRLFFYTLCKKNNLTEKAVIINSISEFLNFTGNKESYYNLHEIYKPHFPFITDELNASYSQNFISDASKIYNEVADHIKKLSYEDLVQYCESTEFLFSPNNNIPVNYINQNFIIPFNEINQNNGAVPTIPNINLATTATIFGTDSGVTTNNQNISGYVNTPDNTSINDSYNSIGKLLEALSLYDKALSLYPTNPVALYNVGLCYSQLSQYALADKYIKSALSLDSSNIQLTKGYISILDAQSRFNDSALYTNKVDELNNIKPEPKIINRNKRKRSIQGLENTAKKSKHNEKNINGLGR